MKLALSSLFCLVATSFAALPPLLQPPPVPQGPGQQQGPQGPGQQQGPQGPGQQLPPGPPPGPPHPTAGVRIDPSRVPPMQEKEIKLHVPGLSALQYGILMPDGRIKAIQYFMKKKLGDFLNMDTERYLELLAYAHEYTEWGNNGPPGGFSIYDSTKPNNNLPMYIPNVGRKKRSAESEENTVAHWPAKIHKMVQRVRRGDQTLKDMVVDVANLYEKELRPAGYPLNRVVREIKTFFDLEKFKRDVIEPEAQGELVTIFDADAEAKYLQFLLRVFRKKKAAGAQEEGQETKKDIAPYVEAVGNYIFVPKDMDVNMLQEEYRKAIKEQRLRRQQATTPL